MYIHNLTYTERRHFENSAMCPICNKPIETFDSFELVKTGYNRHTLYTFFHTLCVVNYHKVKGGDVDEEE